MLPCEQLARDTAALDRAYRARTIGSWITDEHRKLGGQPEAVDIDTAPTEDREEVVGPADG